MQPRSWFGSAFDPLLPEDPREVGGYRLLARLGAGGMGRVYLGSTQSGRRLAIKLVRPELADDAEFRRRFQQEIVAAQRVQSLYTAPVIDADPNAEVPWLATAHIPGPSMAQAVAELGPLPMETVRILTAGVAEALEAIHAAGVIHRDLKPSNVLLAVDGPRVIDFGIARAADATPLTRTGVRIGSPQFMSPEQALGQPSTPAIDVFALGCLAFFAATGTSPFGEGPDAAVLFRIAHEEPSLEGCPDELRSLIATCLAKDPVHRPRLRQIIDDLRPERTLPAAWLPSAITERLPAYTAAPPPAPPTPGPAASAAAMSAARRPANHTKIAAGIGGGLFLILLITLIAMLPNDQSPADQAGSSNTQPANAGPVGSPPANESSPAAPDTPQDTPTTQYLADLEPIGGDDVDISDNPWSTSPVQVKSTTYSKSLSATGEWCDSIQVDYVISAKYSRFHAKVGMAIDSRHTNSLNFFVLADEKRVKTISGVGINNPQTIDISVAGVSRLALGIKASDPELSACPGPEQVGVWIDPRLIG
ncbi:MAG TPA: protein kinase [Streptosporangiaceae bacterium]|nr:protein kinase [Streptosporangiaceae bacterium]